MTTTVHSYRPHSTGWYFLSRADFVLGVAPSAEGQVAELWSVVHGGSSVAALLDELTRGGVSAAPDFVILHLESNGGLQVVVRGSAEVNIPTSDTEPISGAGASAWAERRVPGATNAVCRVVAECESPEVAMALVSGVVRACEFRLGAAIEALAASAPAPSSHRATPPMASVVPSPTLAPPIGVASEETLVAHTTTQVEVPRFAVESSQADSAGGTYAHLFGETVLRTVEDAAVREPQENQEATPADDRTSVASQEDLVRARARRQASRGATKAAEPARFWLELSTGGRESIDQVLIVGRAPSATRVPGGSIPRLITMTTPNQDISRTHVQVSADGGTVVVTDLHSSNGTFITIPGRAPQKLRGGDPTTVIEGTIIDLGDGATLTVREGA